MASTENKPLIDPQDLRPHERELVLNFVHVKQLLKTTEAEIDALAPQVTVLLSIYGTGVLTKSGARVMIANGPGTTIYSSAVTNLERQLSELKAKELKEKIAQVVPSSLKVAKVYLKDEPEEDEKIEAVRDILFGSNETEVKA